MKKIVRLTLAATLLLILAGLLLSCSPQVTVTLNADGGELNGETEYTYLYGLPPQLPTPQRAGYSFTGWDISPYAAADDSILTAQWEPLYLTVTFELNGGTTDSPEQLVQTVLYGETVEPPDVMREYYEFSGWDGDYTEIHENITLSATWTLIPFTEEEIYERCIDSVVELQTYDKSDINISIGSGFIISGDGEIVTAAHVIKGATKIEVRLVDGRKYFASEVVAYDYDRDIAIIKISASGLPTLELSGDDLCAGAPIYAIGSPGGRTGEMTGGEILSISFMYNFTGYITTTMEIEGGSSGSPLLDARGRVIGINVAISNIKEEALSVRIAELSLLEQVNYDMETYARTTAYTSNQRAEDEPNDIMESAQAVATSEFIRATLSRAGDVDCYSSALPCTNILFIISIDKKYYDKITIECTTDNETPRIVEGTGYGISGNNVIIYRTLITNASGVAGIKITAGDGIPAIVPYSLRTIVYDE